MWDLTAPIKQDLHIFMFICFSHVGSFESLGKASPVTKGTIMARLMSCWNTTWPQICCVATWLNALNTYEFNAEMMKLWLDLIATQGEAPSIVVQLIPNTFPIKCVCGSKYLDTLWNTFFSSSLIPVYLTGCSILTQNHPDEFSAVFWPAAS